MNNKTNIMEEIIIKRGRKSKYHFNELETKRMIEFIPKSGDDLSVFRNQVNSALYSFKKHNKLQWTTSVGIHQGKIIVIRYK